MSADQVFHYGESETRTPQFSGTCAVNAVKALPQPVQVSRGYPDTGILYEKGNSSPGIIDTYGNAAFFGKFDAVINEIYYNLNQLVFVRGKGLSAFGQFFS